MAEILKGAPVAAALTAQLTERCEQLKNKGVAPTLAIVRIGEKESDLSYERGAMKRCEKIGVQVRSIVFPEDCSQEELLAAVDRINADSRVHGCIILRPLPGQIDENLVCERLRAEKDVDCITSRSMSAVITGTGSGFAPCTAQSCIEILRYYGIAPEGKNVTVIGRSSVSGWPVSMMLLNMGANVTVCHTQTEDIPAICRRAEILIAAAGNAKMVDQSYVKAGQTVIDVGINVNAEGKLCGDVHFDAVEPLVKAITPVPGGVGAVTTAVLCKHVIEAGEKYCLERA